MFVIDLLPASGFYPETPDLGSTETGQADFRDIAVEYLRMILVAEYLDYALMMICEYFTIQGHSKFVYLVSLVMIGSHVLFNYILVNVLQLGVAGLGSAAILGRITPLTVSLIVCFVMIRKDRFAWNGFSTRALLGWKPMIKLGVSGAINAFAEMALFEISTFFSQFDGTVAMSVVIIEMQFVGAWWSIAMGMSRASATLIGSALGEGDSEKVRSYVKLSVFNVVVVSAGLAAASYYLRSYEVLMFSSEEEVTDLFVGTFWAVCLTIPPDHIQSVLNHGVLVAFGYQSYTAWTMSIACYAIGLPVILATIFFSDLRVSGIFIGIVIADCIVLVTASVRLWKVDIDKEIASSDKRVTGDKETQPCHEDDGECLEIRGNPECVVSYEKFVEEETINTENGTDWKPDEDYENFNSEPRVTILENSTQSWAADEQKNMHADFKEARNVVLAFVSAAVVCVSLTGASLARK